MMLDHFSHHHPLMLISEVRTKYAEEEFLCWGCENLILSSAYSCSKCNYFLHEQCAQSPMEIEHPKHYQHPLTLFSKSPYYDCDCSVCGDVGGWNGFTYSCLTCRFNVHLPCALDESVVVHESHPHPLTVVHRKSLFKCDACGEEAKDSSLFCSTCEFWIHKSCATLPSTIKHSDDDHPLVLQYFLPYENRSFDYDCDICREKLHPNRWVYNCDRCRYFAHIKCVTSEQKQPSRGDIIADDPNTIIRFPLTTEGSIALLSERLMNEVSLVGNERASEIDHFSHGRPLALFDDKSDNITTDKEIVCDCCIRPITSAPFYGCIQCSFFLHIYCTKLPDELQHPCHPEHLLKLHFPLSFVDNFMCKICRCHSNGFCYKCGTCDYCLDISCAFFPKIIKHEGHEHPVQIKLFEPNLLCKSCQSFCFGSGFACEGCDFHLDIFCAELPRTVKHDWDKDPLTLSYPPYSDHPDRFYCEVCEEEMYPKSWAYRSHNRIQFYHVYCVIPRNLYLRTKFGGTLNAENHPHTLTFVRKSKNKSPSLCDRCDMDFKGEPVLECAPCNFVICRTCCTRLI